MRLSAIYIPKNTLPYIFGEDHNGKTLNFGGEFFYSISENDATISIDNREPNIYFIQDFWGENIELITALVGRNGIGKTSILRGINHSIDPKHKDMVYFFETDDITLVHIINETKKTIINNSTIEFILPQESRSFEALYYSPNLDYELKDTHSPITLINQMDDSLEEYYLDSIIRNVFLLHSPLIKTIQQIYPDFPTYENFTIRVKKHRKSRFTRVYADSNFANPNRGDVLKNYLTSDIMRLQEEKDLDVVKENIVSMLQGYVNLLESESMNSLFYKVWDLEDYKHIDDKDNIHDGEDFLKNLEVTILSYLLLGAVFPQTGLGGGLNFDEILSADNFKTRLNKFLELYLINEYAILYEKIKSDLIEVEVSKSEEIIEIIKRDTWIKNGGVDVEPVRQRMITDVTKFHHINEFYNFILNIIENQSLIFEEGVIVFDIKKHDITIFNELVLRYKTLLEHFRDIPTSVSIIELIPDKKLSTGEKAILDFFASLNNYIEKNKVREHTNYQHYILLLDEPELGYHPIWKKKFVDAMVEILPIVFSEITPYVYDKETKQHVRTGEENPILQIIFSTHDPLTLSDIPRNNIVYLEKDESDFSYISDEKFKSFAANITDLLADSFFIEDGLLGDFAKKKINKTILWLNDRDAKSNAEYHKKIIQSIDEPIIKSKLAEMFSEKMKDTLAKDILKKEIDNLTERYNRM